MTRALFLLLLVAETGHGPHLLRAAAPSRASAPSTAPALPACDFSSGCNAGNNLLSVPGDFANAAWTTYGSGAAAPTVSASTTAAVDGVTLAYNRVQFAAVASGQESTVSQRIGGASDLCQNKTCTYSIYLRSHSGAGTPTGNLPIATAGDGNDGTNYQMCPFTASWSRCELTMTGNTTDSYSSFYVGYVEAKSGTSGALDLDLGGPKAEYGAGGATAYQCPSPLQRPGVPYHSGYTLTELDDDWGIVKRDGSGLHVVSGGTLVMTGGWSEAEEASWGNSRTTNEVYKSTNGGLSWTAVLAHSANPSQTGSSARWRRRHSHCSLLATFNGNEYIYVIGGDGLDSSFAFAPADVWRSPSSSLGATWERMTAAAEWGNTTLGADGGYNSRALQMCWVGDDGHLYLAGGQSSYVVAGALRDVWRSTNGGANWTLIGSAPWAARGSPANALPRFQGRTWLYGGMQYDNTTDNRVHYNDVWNTDDGTSWVRVTTASQWAARGYQNALAWNGRLWMLKGVIGQANQSDVWSSSDGVCWRPERDAEGWPSHAVSATVAPDGGHILLTGSATSTGVWRLSAP